MTKHCRTYEEIIAEQDRRLQEAKTPLLGALNSIGVSMVVVEYDGEGDSGQINSVSAAAVDGTTVALTDPVPVAIKELWPGYGTLEAVIEALAWDALAVYHGGFENNDGGYGTLTINVTEGKFLLEHNDRFVDVHSTDTEV